jgi:hypothetical protein
MGRRARDYVRRNYDRTVLADKYLEIIMAVKGRAINGATPAGPVE